MLLSVYNGLEVHAAQPQSSSRFHYFRRPVYLQAQAHKQNHDDQVMALACKQNGYETTVHAQTHANATCSAPERMWKVHYII